MYIYIVLDYIMMMMIIIIISSIDYSYIYRL